MSKCKKLAPCQAVFLYKKLRQMGIYCAKGDYNDDVEGKANINEAREIFFLPLRHTRGPFFALAQMSPFRLPHVTHGDKVETTLI